MVVVSRTNIRTSKKSLSGELAAKVYDDEP